MKRFTKSTLGVTLLEVMLVLAIAAMIIVMSIRYYQSASAGQQANSVIEQLQAITAAADGLAQTTGAYNGSTNSVSSANLAPLLPANAFVTPWGLSITIPSAGPNYYDVNVAGAPASICPLIVTKLKANNHYYNVTSCAADTTTSISYTYLANP